MINIIPIAHIYSKYKTIEECPPNGWATDDISIICIDKSLTDGMLGLTKNMLIHVIWWFDKADRNVLRQQPKTDSAEIGVFAMRSPQRPNPIAISLCRINKIKNNYIYVKGLEALNNSIVLDIKKVIRYNKYIL